MASVLGKITSGRSSLIFPTTLLLLGYISFSHTYNQIAYDMSLYMTYALNILNGKGYMDMDGSPVFFRGPVFPLMIALSFKLFGVNGLSALGVVKLFCVLNPVALYYFGKKLFNQKVGISCALFVLTSYSISFWSFQFIDAVWPFFVLLHCYFLFDGLEQRNNKRLYFALSGVFLGIAILTKEVSILFIPLGLLLLGWVKEYRYRENIRGVYASLFVVLIILLPWLVYLLLYADLSLLIGMAGPVVTENIMDTFNGNETGQQYNIIISLFAALKKFISDFVYFYSGETNTVKTNFTISPLFLASWPIALYCAINGQKGCKLIVLGLLLFSPIIYFIGKNHWRFGQVLISMFFSYIALGYSVSCIVEFLSKRMKNASFISHASFVFMVSTIIVVQIFANKEIDTRNNKDIGFAKIFQKTTLYHFLTEREYLKPEIKGIFVNSHLFEIIKMLRQLPSDHGGIAGADYFTSRSIFYHLEGKKEIHAFPMIWRTINQEKLSMPPENTFEKPLFVSSLLSPLEPQWRLYLLFESQFVDFINLHKIEYVILSPMFQALRKYCNNSEKFELIFKTSQSRDDNEAFSLYRVKEGLKYDGLTQTIYSDDLVLGLNKLFNHDSKRFEQIRDLIFYGDCSFTETDFDSLLQYRAYVPRFHTENGEKYFEEGNLKQAVTSYQEAVRLDPENVRNNCRLGDLYEKIEQFSMALQQYEIAFQLGPDNSFIINRLGALYLKNGLFDRAIDLLREALKSEPENSGFRYLLGSAYQETGSLTLAQKEYEDATRLDPENSAYHRFLGDLYKQTGQVDRAIEQYQKAISLDPENAGYHYLLGSAHQASGSLTLAQKEYEDATRLDPENAAYQRFLGQLYEVTGRYEMALSQFRQAVRLDPKNTSFRYLLGNLYQKMGRHPEALEQFKELIELEPENSQFQKLVEQFKMDQASVVR